MKLNLVKEYRLTSAKFVCEQTGNEYKVFIDKNDRFYTYIRPYIIVEKVTKLSKVMIDRIVVEDKNTTFFDDQTFTLDAVLLVTNIAGVVQSYTFTMKGLCLNHLNVSKQNYENGNWILTLYELQIPYNTDIDIIIRED